MKPKSFLVLLVFSLSLFCAPAWAEEDGSAKAESSVKAEHSPKAEKGSKIEDSSKAESATKAETTVKDEDDAKADSSEKAEKTSKAEDSPKAESPKKTESNKKTESSPVATDECPIPPTCEAGKHYVSDGVDKRGCSKGHCAEGCEKFIQPQCPPGQHVVTEKGTKDNPCPMPHCARK